MLASVRAIGVARLIPPEQTSDELRRFLLQGRARQIEPQVAVPPGRHARLLVPRISKVGPDDLQRRKRPGDVVQVDRTHPVGILVQGDVLLPSGYDSQMKQNRHPVRIRPSVDREIPLIVVVVSRVDDLQSRHPSIPEIVHHRRRIVPQPHQSQGDHPIRRLRLRLHQIVHSPQQAHFVYAQSVALSQQPPQIAFLRPVVNVRIDNHIVLQHNVMAHYEIRVSHNIVQALGSVNCYLRVVWVIQLPGSLEKA